MAPVLRTLLLTIASALVQSATSAHLNKTVYAVTVSSQVTGGSAETLCAQIHGPTERVVLTVSLELESGSSVLLEEAVTQDFYRCQTFQVPVVSASTVATVNVTVRGESESMSKKTKVLINPPSFIRLIQTDKPIYKPGQTVRFRIVSLDSSFIPLNQMYKTVELQDPNRNRIAQWLDRAAGGGILDLSHAMSPEAAQGTYTITAWTDEGETMEHNFDIKAYVLPKYEVTVNLPKVITILDQEATVTVCAKYTYGKPVLGVVKAEVCRRVRRWFREELEKDICKKTELTTDKAGCATYTLNITEFAPRKNVYMDTFEVEAEMEEHGTGVVLEARGRSSFTNRMRTVTFVDVADAYKPGIAFEGMVKVTGPDSKPLAGELVHLEVNAGLDNVSLTTNRKGLASFSLDTSLWKEWVSLQARFVKEELQAPPQGRVPTYGNDYKRVVPFYSKSRSFLKLMQRSHRFSCKEDAAVHAKYIIQGGELKKEQEVLDFFYTVMSRGEIVQHGRLSVAIKAGIVNKGEFSIPLRRLTDLAPYAQLVVYTVMPGGEAVADSQNFPIQLCLKNKVSLKFSSLQELPGEKTTLNLQAQPGSLCSVRAIDQSVLLLQTEKELSVDSVYSQLPVEKMSGYSYQVEDFDPYPCFNLLAEPAMEVDPRFRRRRSYIYLPREKSDVYSIFKEIGMKIVTNSDVKKPYDCHEREIELLEEEYAGFEFDESSVMDDVQSVAFSPKKDSNKKDKSQTTVRSYFPETWIWDLVPVGDSGTASIDKTVPDTITKWAAGAFCTSPVGFGLSPNAALTAFQPFFVSLTLPYSVVRGEVFTLKATVFNYLSKCIMVKASLELSKDYTFRECDGCQYRLCLCGEESKTFRWIVTPASLGVVSLKVTAEALKTEELCGNEVATIPEKGRIDTVVRDLLVEAEGSPEAVSHNALLCPTEGPVEKSISLLLPEMFVAGSAKAFVSVLGDLMGRAMKNLDKLLAMPYGCGEQNMVLFAPNIYILNYLSSTGQLTQDIQDRATRFLESGYQRELNYKHDDGSYSAFGKSDNSGNTWLTSFVMKSFGGARPYIFVDPGHIAEARKWLGSHQRSDGCINSVGKLFHNGMKGGVSDDVSLTAYITAALLELDGNATAPEVERSLRCLKLAVAGQLDNMYTTALLAYTFTLAGDEETRAKLITYMHQKAIIEGGMRHWARAEASAKRLDSLEVEMTAYVLLALLSGPPVPGFHLDYSSDIVRWLAQQQNPYGGFASTQDTVVALQALAKYGTATYRADGASTVVVTSLGGFRQDFTVDQSNRLLYQEEQLPEVPGEYKVSARGQGCVLTQIALRYNIPPPADFSTFHITANTAAKCNGTAPQLLVSVGVRYQGRRAETNMVIINIKLLSGFVLDESSLMLLNTERSVKRVDVEEGYVNIYLDSLKKDETKTYSWTMAEEVPVRNLKPAVVKVYDYYQTSDEAITDYSSPCAESDDANEF